MHEDLVEVRGAELVGHRREVGHGADVAVGAERLGHVGEVAVDVDEHRRPVAREGSRQVRGHERAARTATGAVHGHDAREALEQPRWPSAT